MASDHVRAYSVGAVQQHFNVSSAKVIPIPVPSLLVQDQVLSVLRSLDDRIDLLRQTNTTLEAIAQALFKSWFVDFDPVHAKAEGREPEAMDAATAALLPSECVFRSMPATDSGACRPGIPVHAGHPFRSMPAGVSEAG